MLNNTYRDPGEGAIKYANQVFEGNSRVEIEMMLSALLKGDLNKAEDKRVKRCDYCNYWFCDDSLRNTCRTCCDDCKISYKTLQRRKQRAEKAFLNPKPKKETKSDLYLWWLEYPCWANEQAMIEVGWRFEKPMSARKMDYVLSQQEKYGKGNRKKKAEIINYNGNELE
ncbi:hypothetical protein [Priestia flexa]|uniref:hypothetical protein n=1 Tax=Priestia flexa TaxID=86664 RepID=UPI001C964D1D|nr:hypothetical protein [Priestia flexa]MBY6087007.1 hypothetical protein [Priestia flexa]